MVFATVFFHELVLLATGFREGKGGTNAHGSEREWGNTTGYHRCREYGADMA
jgi:hypothetical protein